VTVLLGQAENAVLTVRTSLADLLRDAITFSSKLATRSCRVGYSGYHVLNWNPVLARSSVVQNDITTPAVFDQNCIKIISGKNLTVNNQVQES